MTFGYVLVISFYLGKMISELATKSSSCLTNVYLFAISASYAIDDLGGGARDMMCNLNGLLESRHFLCVMIERKGFATCARAYESSRLVISL